VETNSVGCLGQRLDVRACGFPPSLVPHRVGGQRGTTRGVRQIESERKFPDYAVCYVLMASFTFARARRSSLWPA
jgi:hypothetical protein